MEDDECPAEAYQAIDDADVLKSIMEYEAIETPSKYLAVERLVNQITKDGGKSCNLGKLLFIQSMV